MIATILAVLQGTPIPPAVEASPPFWPTSVSVWLLLPLSVVTLLGAIYAWVKQLAHINGLGGRVTDIEARQTRLETQARTFEEWMKLEMQARSHLSEALGAATATGQKAMQELALSRKEITEGMHKLQLSTVDSNSIVVQRIAALEAVVRDRDKR